MDRVVRGIKVEKLADGQRMTVVELREELRRRCLRTTGRKPEMVARLEAALLLERDLAVSDEEELSCEDYEYEDEKVYDAASALGLSTGSRVNEGDRRSYYARVIRRRSGNPVLLTFKDVEDTMKEFSGDNNSNVHQWFQEFEKMADLCQWNEIQKIIYAKQLLEGSAKIFVNYEGCAKTWKMLKQALIEEFGEDVDIPQIHRVLYKRLKRKEESLQEYAYKMLEIAAPAKLSVRDVIQYIILGIPDTPLNKAVLYGAKNMSQLKEKFLEYEKIKYEKAKSRARPFEKKADKTAKLAVDQPENEGPGRFVPEMEEKTCFNHSGVSVVSYPKDKVKNCSKFFGMDGVFQEMYACLLVER